MWKVTGQSGRGTLVMREYNGGEGTERESETGVEVGWKSTKMKQHKNSILKPITLQVQLKHMK